MNEKVYNVLLVCSGNSARSIMAEALLNILGKGRFKAYSAGTRPVGMVHPYALDQLRNVGYPFELLRSKNWEEYVGPGAPQMDFVITVCDSAAAEPCPVWPGSPIMAHWGFADPAAIQGTEEEKRRAFARVFHQIRSRINIFINLPLTQVDRGALQTEVQSVAMVPESN